MAPIRTGTRDIYLDANGIRHHLIARGSPGGPAVMMIHGLSQQAHVFDAIATRLSERFHVYALDVRGRGESGWGPADGYHTANYVADLEAIRDNLDLERIALVGTSMGGLIAMHYAARHPDRVTRLVMNDIGPAVDPSGLERVRGYVGTAPEAFPDLKAVVRWYREHYPAYVRRSDDDAAEMVRWNVRKSDTGLWVWKMDPAVRAFAAPPPDIDPWEAYRSIRCPLLVLRGSESDILSPDIVEKMLGAHPGSRSVEVPGVGHAPALSEPAAIEAIEKFLSAPA